MKWHSFQGYKDDSVSANLLMFYTTLIKWKIKVI